MNVPQLDNIVILRKKLGISQAKLAKLARVSQSMINKIENGIKKPSYPTALKIFTALEEIEIEKVNQKLGIKGGDIATRIIISVAPLDDLKIAIQKMGDHLDQLPVFDKGFKNEDICNVGSISNKIILKHLDCEDFNDLKVVDIMEDPFPVVSENENLQNIKRILEIYEAVLISHKGRISGIITRSDIIKNI
jgi:predicted transcriptional regulator